MSLEKRVKQRIDNNLNKFVKNPYPEKKQKRPWKRFVFPALAVALAASIIAPILIWKTNNLEGIINRLTGTYVDMEDVTAFGIWNAPEKKGAKARITNLHYLHETANELEETSEYSEGSSRELTSEEIDRMDWESDYDWDPDKANVLISLDENGKIEEVVYEMTNGRGQVRQSKLGHATSMYVANGFTYVMYVSDNEWEFWGDINYIQEMVGPSGFHCHHEEMQTVVIHNETGKVFALKDLMKQVGEIANGKQYTMQVHPTKDDYLYTYPLYGTTAYSQWYKVIYDENGLRYRYALPENSGHRRIHAIHDDIYGQTFALVDDEGYDQTVRLGPKLVDTPYTKIVETTLLCTATNGIMYGSDHRAYMVDNGVLKVFGENFALTPVEKGLTVNLEGMANEFFENDTGWLNGICYHLEDNYLYSMFGEVWSLDENAVLTKQESLEGSFPLAASDGFMINGEIIAFVDTEVELHYSIDGNIVHMKFGLDNGVPSVKEELVIESTELWSYGHRVIALQDEYGGMSRGPCKYYLLRVENGKVSADYVAEGNHGGMNRLVKPVTEPLVLS